MRAIELSSVGKMFFVLADDILRLSAEELRFIPKVILLQEFGQYVDRLWEKLPEHLTADREVQGYRRCFKHYNQPWQRDHIDGPTPYVKDCVICNSQAENS